MVDPKIKQCSTLAGSGKSGLVDGSFVHAQFSEPGGLSLDPKGRTLFVADTNNHIIRVLDLDQKTVTQVSTINEGWLPILSRLSRFGIVLPQMYT